ncbi:MAG: (2Fe-2S)-binding protein [Planctomycetota bacterium]
MPVTRCVCHEVPFTEVVRLAREEGLGLDEIGERTGCGEGCGSCRPYARLAIATGKTRLPVLSADQLARAIERATAST